VSDDALTDVLTLASAWWVKDLVFIAVALAYDLWHRRPPVNALIVAAAFVLSSIASTSIKIVVDRPRPHDNPLIPLPSSASFPSGHATTAFAAAVALSLLVPRTGWLAIPLAAVIAYSRVYLGVHYWSDVIAGALIGSAVAVLVVVAVRRRRSMLVASPRTRPR
jgi:membrane-associated phospholipid phosphatase